MRDFVSLWNMGKIRNEIFSEVALSYRFDFIGHKFSEALANLGAMYAIGEGVAHDLGLAMDLLHASANQENSIGQYFLGLIYAFDQSLNACYVTEGVRLLEDSSTNSNEMAKRILALDRGDIISTGYRGLDSSFEGARLMNRTLHLLTILGERNERAKRLVHLLTQSLHSQSQVEQQEGSVQPLKLQYSTKEQKVVAKPCQDNQDHLCRIGHRSLELQSYQDELARLCGIANRSHALERKVPGRLPWLKTAPYPASAGSG